MTERSTGRGYGDSPMIRASRAGWMLRPDCKWARRLNGREIVPATIARSGPFVFAATSRAALQVDQEIARHRGARA